jgi:uncharacterized protein (DUF433 family)
MLERMSPRITIEPGKRSGQPCVRGLRITVWDVLNWLAAGMTEQQILDDYPELEPDDFHAVYEFAARGAAPGRSPYTGSSTSISRTVEPGDRPVCKVSQ